MATVKNLLETKGTQVWTIAPDETVLAALEAMAEHHLGALVVMEAGKVAGIFSERDYARKSVGLADFSLNTPVRDLMSHPVYYVSPDQSVDECMTVMTAKHFRHLPVMENEQLVGIISIGDVVKQVITEREIEIKNLENFLWVNMI